MPGLRALYRACHLAADAVAQLYRGVLLHSTASHARAKHIRAGSDRLEKAAVGTLMLLFLTPSVKDRYATGRREVLRSATLHVGVSC